MDETQALKQPLFYNHHNAGKVSDYGARAAELTKTSHGKLSRNQRRKKGVPLPPRPAEEEQGSLHPRPARLPRRLKVMGREHADTKEANDLVNALTKPDAKA